MSAPEVASSVNPDLAVHSWRRPGSSSHGLPWVLLHGWGADSRSWQPLIDALPEGAACSSIEAIDLPGFGASPAGDETLPAILKRLEATLPERCVLVGWSLGGMLATLLAARCPERVEALVTIATNACYVEQPGWTNAMPEATFAAFYSAFASDPAQCLKRFGALQAHGDRAGRTVTRHLRDWQSIPEGEQHRVWLRSLELLRGLDLRPALNALELPALHMFGAGDALVPVAVADDFAVGAKRSVRVLDDCGHAPHISQPANVTALVDAFLEQVLPIYTKEQLDKQSVARSFSRAAAQYDSAAHLQRRLGEQLLARMGAPETGEGADAVPAVVERVLDLGCGTGYFLPLLGATFPSAELLGADLAEGMVTHARQQRAVSAVWLCADAEHLPFATGTIDLVFSNLALQWCEDLPQLASELHRVLSPGGHAVFTTLGPNTLNELRQAWAAVDDAVHVNRFPDSCEVRRALSHAGFERLRLETTHEVVHYPVLANLLRELKTLGANNVNRGRPSTLTGRERIRALEAAYEAHREAEGLPATWEVYFVVASKGGA